MTNDSIFDGLEAYYLHALENAKLEDIDAYVWRSYKKCVFPSLVCKEWGEDQSALLSALRDVDHVKGEPKMSRLYRALCLIKKDKLDEQEPDLHKEKEVLAIAYGSMQEGENFSTASLPPVEILEAVGCKLSTIEYYAVYKHAVEEYGLDFLNQCDTAYKMMSNDKKKALTRAMSNNTQVLEKKEKTKDVAKTSGKIVARVGIVALAHTYGNIVSIVALIWAVIALLLGFFYWYIGVLLAAIACFAVVVCAATVAFQIFVTSGSNLKLLIISFYLGCFLSWCIVLYMVISIILGSISIVKEVL